MRFQLVSKAAPQITDNIDIRHRIIGTHWTFVLVNELDMIMKGWMCHRKKEYVMNLLTIHVPTYLYG